MPKLNFFEKVKIKKPRHSTFDLSHLNTLTTEFGALTPIYFESVVPGDKFRGSSEFFMRFQPMIAPVMHNIDISVHYFYVPERLVWKHFGDWIKGFSQENSPVPQYLLLQEVNTYHSSQYCPDGVTHEQICGNGSLWDYLGYPILDETKNYGNQRVKANRLLAYALIWREYYRDQNLMDEVDLFDDQDGRIPPSQYINFFFLKQRCWEKDYFTSALPWPQRGADVTLPLTGDAPVTGSSEVNLSTVGAGGTYMKHNDGTSVSDRSSVQLGGPTAQGNPMLDDDDLRIAFDTQARITVAQPGQYNTLSADMSQVTAATINDLRKANALQKWFELKARTGNRLKEFLLGNFGVAPKDLRLDRPQYLGGGKQPVVVSDVLQNSSTDTTSPQGNLAGQAAASGRTNSFKKFVDEHGFIIGIMSVMPRSMYQNGCPRDLQKFDQLDYFFPVFQHLGEQEIKNSEIFFSNDLASNEGTFGYTPRYAEYKFHGNEVHGDMRGNLYWWHLGRIFANTPTLSPQFVQVRPEQSGDNLNRIFAVQRTPSEHLLVQVYNHCRAIRPMDYYSIPAL